MSASRTIKVKHMSRIEGHGNITINIRNGRVHEARWEVVETPRFFEALLVGKNWETIPWIVGRICGICSIGHTLAGIRAVENAFHVRPDPVTVCLRMLVKHMETLQSHILHLYFLVAPDFLKAGSVFPLIRSHPDIVSRALRIKHLANEACDIIGGRRLHAVRLIVGGFTMVPEKHDLENLRIRLIAIVEDLEKTADLFHSFNLPDFTRETEYVSLKGNGTYPFIGGDLISSDGVRKKESEYREITNEYMVRRSTSKWCRLTRKSYAVGALARLNNNFQHLHAEARKVALSFGLLPANYNPFMNSVAQLVECFHVVYDSVNIINTLLDLRWGKTRKSVRPESGIGTSAVEVPRGILFHSYEFDRHGTIKKCDCVIPTGQNNANIHYDLHDLAALCFEKGMNDEEIRQHAEMLVRAYDPCISCSVH